MGETPLVNRRPFPDLHCHHGRWDLAYFFMNHVDVNVFSCLSLQRSHEPGQEKGGQSSHGFCSRSPASLALGQLALQGWGPRGQDPDPPLFNLLLSGARGCLGEVLNHCW